MVIGCKYALDVSDRYIAKSDPWIIMVSTPNAPGGLFERIEKEPEETCLYKRFSLTIHMVLTEYTQEKKLKRLKLHPHLKESTT
jgi:hypothetical protein